MATNEGERPKHPYRDPTDEEIEELKQVQEATTVEQLVELARKNLAEHEPQRRGLFRRRKPSPD